MSSNSSPSKPRDNAIEVRGVGKSYVISHNAPEHVTLAEAALHRVLKPRQRSTKETFWSLQDISFDIAQGDVVGVIGRNGAGKSTLLKVLSQITEPTTGEIQLFGRVGSLLEVGTGFHPELTGRENIFLNGAILGMRRREITRLFDEIVDFAGVEQFLDTPVKRYSSGMYVRLAFAVAASLSSEILLVDEVLAVGDAQFQRKCLGKMRDVASSGRTVIFVSHHMQSVQVLCNRAMYLDKGRMTYLGDVPGAIQKYMESFEKSERAVSDPHKRPGSGELRFTHVTPTKELWECGEEKVVHFSIKRFKPYQGQFFVSAHIVDAYGVIVTQCDSRMVEHWIEVDGAENYRYDGEFRIKTPWLKPGAYHMDLFVCNAGVFDQFEQACHLEVLPLLPYPAAGNDEAMARGQVLADYSYRDRDGSEAASRENFANEHRVLNVASSEVTTKVTNADIDVVQVESSRAAPVSS